MVQSEGTRMERDTYSLFFIQNTWVGPTGHLPELFSWKSAQKCEETRHVVYLDTGITHIIYHTQLTNSQSKHGHQELRQPKSIVAFSHTAQTASSRATATDAANAITIRFAYALSERVYEHSDAFCFLPLPMLSAPELEKCIYNKLYFGMLMFCYQINYYALSWKLRECVMYGIIVL